jgi:hypothetical protein
MSDSKYDATVCRLKNDSESFEVDVDTAEPLPKEHATEYWARVIEFEKLVVSRNGHGVLSSAFVDFP